MTKSTKQSFDCGIFTDQETGAVYFAANAEKYTEEQSKAMANKLLGEVEPAYTEYENYIRHGLGYINKVKKNIWWICHLKPERSVKAHVFKPVEAAK